MVDREVIKLFPINVFNWSIYGVSGVFMVWLYDMKSGPSPQCVVLPNITLPNFDISQYVHNLDK